MERSAMELAQAGPDLVPQVEVPAGIELRHLRYFVALADAGSFTHAAKRMFITQPTLSQQIRRLEEIVGTPLVQRRREGLRLTKAGTVLLDASRNVLSLVDHEVSHTRQAAGLERQRLRVGMPPHMPDCVAVEAAAALRAAAAAADVDVIWLETSLDAEFSLIRQHRADAGLGWLTASPDALGAPLDGMSLREFEPDVWIPSSHPAARRGSISLAQVVSMDVIHGPRCAEAGTYDAWTRVLRATDPRFEFTDPPFRHSLPMALAFASTGDRPTAVLTGPSEVAGTRPGLIRLRRSAGIRDMARVRIDNRPLTATAALVWRGDLPRPLQQILFETADGIGPARYAELVPVSHHVRLSILVRGLMLCLLGYVMPQGAMGHGGNAAADRADDGQPAPRAAARRRPVRGGVQVGRRGRGPPRERRGRCPRRSEPMMASLRRGLPHDDDRYGWEFKWDGVRAVAYVSGGQILLLSRMHARHPPGHLVREVPVQLYLFDL